MTNTEITNRLSNRRRSKRLQRRSGTQGFEDDARFLFEPATKSFEDTNEISYEQSEATKEAFFKSQEKYFWENTCKDSHIPL